MILGQLIILVLGILTLTSVTIGRRFRKDVREKAEGLHQSYASVGDGGLRISSRSQEQTQPEISVQKSIDNKIPAKKEERIANFLLAGAQKAGTTATVQYLFQNSEVCGPTQRPGLEYTQKEAHFFNEEHTLARGLSHYQSLFEPCADSKIIMDATPNYMPYPERIRKLYEQQGTADTLKVLFILREPVSREISWYNHLLRENSFEDTPEWAKTLVKDDGSLQTFAERTEDKIVGEINDPNGENLGVYSRWLKRWFEQFDRKQILVVSYDDLKANQTDFLERVHKFMGLPVTDELLLPQSNSEHVPNESSPSCSAQDTLAELYEPYNKELYALLEENPGPDMEKRPFTPFNRRLCKEE